MDKGLSFFPSPETNVIGRTLRSSEKQGGINFRGKMFAVTASSSGVQILEIHLNIQARRYETFETDALDEILFHYGSVVVPTRIRIDFGE
jgi:hypothetical protein